MNCVVPENIHTLSTEGNGNSEGRVGDPKGGNFRGGGGGFSRSFPGGSE